MAVYIGTKKISSKADVSKLSRAERRIYRRLPKTSRQRAETGTKIHKTLVTPVTEQKLPPPEMKAVEEGAVVTVEPTAKGGYVHTAASDPRTAEILAEYTRQQMQKKYEERKARAEKEYQEKRTATIHKYQEMYKKDVEAKTGVGYLERPSVFMYSKRQTSITQPKGTPVLWKVPSKVTGVLLPTIAYRQEVTPEPKQQPEPIYSPSSVLAVTRGEKVVGIKPDRERPDFSTSFERAVESQQKREEKFLYRLRPFAESAEYYATQFQRGVGLYREKILKPIVGTQAASIITKPFTSSLMKKGLTMSGVAPLYLMALPALATEKMYLVGRGVVTAPERTIKETYISAPFRTIKKTYDPRTEEGKLTYIFAATGALIPAIAGVRSPLSIPESVKFGESVKSYRYVKEIPETPFPGKTGRSGGIVLEALKGKLGTKDYKIGKEMLSRDTHTFTTKYVQKGKPVVEVSRVKSGDISYTLVKVGGKVYGQIHRPASRVRPPKVTTSVIEQGKVGKTIVTTKTTRWATSKELKGFEPKKVYKPITRIIETPIYQQKYKATKRERIFESELFEKYKGVQVRIDTFQTVAKYERPTSFFKKEVVVMKSQKVVSQIAKLKASQTLYTRGQVLRLSKEGVSKQFENIFEMKGKYPKLIKGKLEKPIDVIKTDIRMSKGMQPDINIENIMFDKFRGARLFKETTKTYKEKDMFRISRVSRLPEHVARFKKEMGGFVSKPLLGKKAMSHLDPLSIYKRVEVVKIGRLPSPTKPKPSKFDFMESSEIVSSIYSSHLKPKTFPVLTSFIKVKDKRKSKMKGRSRFSDIIRYASESEIGQRFNGEFKDIIRQRDQPISKFGESVITIPRQKITPITKQKVSQVIMFGSIFPTKPVKYIFDINIPPTVSTPTRPPIIPPPFPKWEFGRQYSKPRVIKKRKKKPRYTPSMIAQAFNIFGKRPTGKLTGLEIRPMLRTRRGKRK